MRSESQAAEWVFGLNGLALNTHTHAMTQYLHATLSYAFFCLFVCCFFLNGCKEKVQKCIKMATPLNWTICNAGKMCWFVFGGVRSQSCMHGSLQRCSVKHVVCIWRALQGLYSFHPILPVRSPSLAVPSSYCSSYRNIKKQKCIQDWQIQNIWFIIIDRNDGWCWWDRI